eukprot:scaffold15515_cov104-Isochrysis_galbana.AAC.3
MSSHDEVKVVLLQKFAHDVGAKRVRDAAVVLGPPHDVRLRVRPEQIAQQARVGHVCGPHDALDLLWLLQVGRQTSMYAKDLLVDNGREGQQIKHLLELLPNLYIQTPLACAGRRRGRLGMGRWQWAVCLQDSDGGPAARRRGPWSAHSS